MKNSWKIIDLRFWPNGSKRYEVSKTSNRRKEKFWSNNGRLERIDFFEERQTQKGFFFLRQSIVFPIEGYAHLNLFQSNEAICSFLIGPKQNADE